MIEINPQCLYSRADLAQLLAPAGVDVDHFLSRLGARKVFKQLWLGADLLEAYRHAPELAERAGATAERRRPKSTIQPMPARTQAKRRGPGRPDPAAQLLAEFRPRKPKARQGGAIDSEANG